MKIYPVAAFSIKKSRLEPSTGQTTQENKINKNVEQHYFNDQLIMFGARVDKGLERFYETNMDKMPDTVRNYIESLDNKSAVTPMEAQKNAYELLDIAQTPDDIKSAYPEEKLFQDLINPLESRATRGILNSVRENDELLKLSGQGVLKDKENLTVYLVKKIFLENKTIEEINQDLDKDLDEDFKADFKFKNPKAQYVYTSTLASLGIKAPQFEYRQSLRYTQEGYSDMIGDKISEGQRAFWDSLSTEDRTGRAKKSAEKFENWWNSLTRNQILDMIADQKNELDLLKEFKKAQRLEEKANKVTNNEPEETPRTTRKHTKVGSNKLSQDELFVIWASNQLKIWQASLTEAEKDTLHIKRMQRHTARWKEMTPAEKSDYISKMKAGAEPLRYTMIDAWNHSTKLIQDLSAHLKANQIYKPADILYSSQEFSEFQSRVMTEFWENHPEYSKELGENIQRSQEKIQDAISRGTFEELKKQIMRDKNRRIKEMESFNKKTIQPQTTIETEELTYISDFKSAYYKVQGATLKNLPPEYVADYFKVITEGFSQEQIEAWTRNLKGEDPELGDNELLTQISQTEPEGSQIINRAIEGALADTLYECTRDPNVYILSHSDMKVALAQIDRGERVIKIGSHKLHQMFEFEIVKKKIDRNRINYLYNQYKQDLDDEDLRAIASEYFTANDGDYTPLLDYMKTYGKSLNIIFSDKSTYSNLVKAAMFTRFALNMPSSISHAYDCLLLTDKEEPLKKEDELKALKFLISKRFDFVPKVFMNNYLSEFGASIRRSRGLDLEEVKKGCYKRTDTQSRARLTITPKYNYRTINALRALAMEQALADALYEATENQDVYKLQFEELCDNIELFKMIRKFPSESRTFVSSGGDTISLAAKRPVNTNSLQRDYLDYVNQIVDWVNTDVKDDNGTLDDLVCILNPDENAPEIDKNVEQRIKIYQLNLK